MIATLPSSRAISFPVVRHVDRPVHLASGQHGFAVPDHGDVARLDPGFERHHLAVLPQIHRHGLPRKHRRGKAHGVLPERAGIIIGVGLQHRAAGQAVGAHAVQDRPRKPGLARELRIAVQRVAVAAQPVDQRLVRPRRDIDGAVRRPRRHRMRRRLALGRAAEAAIAAREGRADQRRQLVAGFVPEHRFTCHHGALVLALVVDGQDAGIRENLRRHRQRLVEGDVAFAIHHQQAVDAEIAGTGAPGRDRGEGRHHLQRARVEASFVDVRQFPLVHGIGAQTDAIGIEHHLAVGPCIGVALPLQTEDLGILDRHDVSFSAASPLFVIRQSA